MNVSVFSLLMSVLWSSLIILVAHLLRRKAFFLRRVGAPVLVVFYLLSVGRMVLPVEFPFSREVPLRSWFSTAVQAVCIEEHQLGDFGWTWAQAACLCWAAVGIILLLWFSFRYWRAVRRMTQSLARDPLAEEILQSIRKESKRSLKVQVFRTERASTPMGVGNLPTEDYSPLWRDTSSGTGVYPASRVHPLPPWRPVGEAAHSGVLLLVLVEPPGVPAATGSATDPGDSL